MKFIVLAIVYLIGRFALGNWMNEINVYGSYYFELIIVTIYVSLYGKSVLDSFRINQRMLIAGVVAIGFGFGIYEFAIAQDILIPFDMKAKETLFFLLLVAPVLEEILFHSLLWKPLEKKPMVAFVATAVLFSYAHLHAIWFYPEMVHGFIQYQTAYTLVLGFLCGLPVLLYGSLAGAMMIHFGFNLGFYLGYAF